MRAPPEPTLALAQAQARWGSEVVMAGLFRPGPDPTARTALTKAVSRRTNRRRSNLPGRVLVAVDHRGWALVCPLVADAQGGHPAGDDLFAAPFEELGAVMAGELSIVVLLAEDWPVVLEAVWLDHDAATVAALLAGEPLPPKPDEPEARFDDDEDEDDEDDEPSREDLLAEAEAAQARADAFRALAAAKVEDPPPATQPPPDPGPTGSETAPPPPAAPPAAGDGSPA